MSLHRNSPYLLFCMGVLCPYSVCGSQCYYWLLILSLVSEGDTLGCTLVMLVPDSGSVQILEAGVTGDFWWKLLNSCCSVLTDIGVSLSSAQACLVRLYLFGPLHLTGFLVLKNKCKYNCINVWCLQMKTVAPSSIFWESLFPNP